MNYLEKIYQLIIIRLSTVDHLSSYQTVYALTTNLYFLD